MTTHLRFVYQDGIDLQSAADLTDSLEHAQLQSDSMRRVPMGQLLTASVPQVCPNWTPEASNIWSMVAASRSKKTGSKRKTWCYFVKDFFIEGCFALCKCRNITTAGNEDILQKCIVLSLFWHLGGFGDFQKKTPKRTLCSKVVM